MKVFIKEDVYLEKILSVKVEQYKAGEIVELEDALAQELINNQKAIPFDVFVALISQTLNTEEPKQEEFTSTETDTTEQEGIAPTEDKTMEPEEVK